MMQPARWLPDFKPSGRPSWQIAAAVIGSAAFALSPVALRLPAPVAVGVGIAGLVLFWLSLSQLTVDLIAARLDRRDRSADDAGRQ